MRNQEIYSKIKSNLDAIAKPLDSLGDFEEIIARMGAVLKDQTVNISKAALIVFCSDNGIIEEGVSQSDEAVTLSVTKLLGERRSSVCHMAKEAGVDVFPVNLGVKPAAAINPADPGIKPAGKSCRRIPGTDGSFYISEGTANFLKKPAMTKAQCRKAMDAGQAYIEALSQKGYTCFMLGEMGIGNTTTSTAVIYALTGMDLDKLCGRGAGLSDEGLKRKKAVIRKAYEKYDLGNKPPMEILQTVGGYDIAAMVGAILKASELSYPVILDGVITAAAAITAVRLKESGYRCGNNDGSRNDDGYGNVADAGKVTEAENAADILFASHKGKEKGAELVLSELGLKPVIDADLALGEGTGAVLFYHLLKCAKQVYDENTSFADAGIEAYKRF